MELAVHDLGGEGERLVLVHATGFHAMVWKPVVEHLERFHSWAPDIRAHGDSTSPEGGDFAWSGFADDVLATVDSLGSNGIAGVGHSMGGAALLLAEQRRPGTFRSLYLYEPVVFPPEVVEIFLGKLGDDENPMANAALRRREVFTTRQAAFDNFASKPPFDILAHEALHAYVDHGFADEPDGSVRLKCHPKDEAEIYRTGWKHAAFDHLGEVRCPVFVARGENGPPGPGTFAPQIVDALVHGHLISFAELGHFGPLEKPALIAASIDDALARS